MSRCVSHLYVKDRLDVGRELKVEGLIRTSRLCADQTMIRNLSVESLNITNICGDGNPRHPLTIDNKVIITKDLKVNGNQKIVGNVKIGEDLEIEKNLTIDEYGPLIVGHNNPWFRQATNIDTTMSLQLMGSGPNGAGARITLGDAYDPTIASGTVYIAEAGWIDPLTGNSDQLELYGENGIILNGDVHETSLVTVNGGIVLNRGDISVSNGNILVSETTYANGGVSTYKIFPSYVGGDLKLVNKTVSLQLRAPRYNGSISFSLRDNYDPAKDSVYFIFNLADEGTTITVYAYMNFISDNNANIPTPCLGPNYPPCDTLPYLGNFNPSGIGSHLSAGYDRSFLASQKGFSLRSSSALNDVDLKKLFSITDDVAYSQWKLEQSQDLSSMGLRLHIYRQYAHGIMIHDGLVKVLTRRNEDSEQTLRINGKIIADHQLISTAPDQLITAEIALERAKVAIGRNHQLKDPVSTNHVHTGLPDHHRDHYVNPQIRYRLSGNSPSMPIGRAQYVPVYHVIVHTTVGFKQVRVNAITGHITEHIAGGCHFCPPKPTFYQLDPAGNYTNGHPGLANTAYARVIEDGEEQNARHVTTTQISLEPPLYMLGGYYLNCPIQISYVENMVISPIINGPDNCFPSQDFPGKSYYFDAIFAVQESIRMFYERYGQLSYNNLGGGLTLLLDYPPVINNAAAFPDAEMIAIGPGIPTPGAKWPPFTSLEILSHEFEHLVQAYYWGVSGIDDQGETGALMEGFADIFSMIITEHTNRTTGATIHNTRETSCRGSDVTGSIGLRYTKHPNQTANFGIGIFPSSYQGNAWINEPHHMSTPISHLFYILWYGQEGTNEFGINYHIYSPEHDTNPTDPALPTALGYDNVANLFQLVNVGFTTSTSDYASCASFLRIAGDLLFGPESGNSHPEYILAIEEGLRATNLLAVRPANFIINLFISDNNLNLPQEIPQYLSSLINSFMSKATSTVNGSSLKIGDYTQLLITYATPGYNQLNGLISEVEQTEISPNTINVQGLPNSPDKLQPGDLYRNGNILSIV